MENQSKLEAISFDVGLQSQPKYVIPEGVFDGPPLKRLRRKRTVYSDQEVHLLESVFKTNRYPDITIRETISGVIKINESRIQTWFQHRRRRERTEVRNYVREILPTSNEDATKIQKPKQEQPSPQQPRSSSPEKPTMEPKTAFPFAPVAPHVATKRSLHHVPTSVCKTSKQIPHPLILKSDKLRSSVHEKRPSVPSYIYPNVPVPFVTYPVYYRVQRSRLPQCVHLPIVPSALPAWPLEPHHRRTADPPISLDIKQPQSALSAWPLEPHHPRTADPPISLDIKQPQFCRPWSN
ncbi:uncharacterized protein [Antedon mediterranea]|uniref:uncharacterized protein n=1 Tax=Antedon mediterranea TaxID=105859 RepID=UPI003AF52C2E